MLNEKEFSLLLEQSEIPEGLAKSLAGLGMVAALGVGATGQLDKSGESHHMQDADQDKIEMVVQDIDRNDKSVTDPAQTATIISDMARNVRRSSLGGMQQNRTQAQIFLQRVINSVDSGKMSPQDGINAIQSHYDVSDDTVSALQKILN